MKTKNDLMKTDKITYCHFSRRAFTPILTALALLLFGGLSEAASAASLSKETPRILAVAHPAPGRQP